MFYHYTQDKSSGLLSLTSHNYMNVFVNVLNLNKCTLPSKINGKSLISH